MRTARDQRAHRRSRGSQCPCRSASRISLAWSRGLPVSGEDGGSAFVSCQPLSSARQCGNLFPSRNRHPEEALMPFSAIERETTGPVATIKIKPFERTVAEGAKHG